MIIKELVIYGYGKWIDKRFTLNENLQVFIGDNESGKSTISAFIQHILFGFPRSNSRERQYEPKFSTEYGGKLIVEDDRYGNLSIERVVKQRVSGDVTIRFENGESADESFLETLLFGISKEFYQETFAFDLNGLQDVEQLSKDEANRYFVDAGLLGGDRFIKLKDELDTKAERLYSPKATTRPLNVAIKELEDLTNQLQAAKEKNSEYLDLVAEKQRLASSEQTVQEKRLKLQDEARYLKQLSNNYEKYARYEKLKQHFQDTPLVQLPTDGLQELQRYQEQLEEIDKKIIEQETKLSGLKEQYSPTELLQTYQENVETFKNIEKQLPYIEEAMTQNTRLIDQQNILIEKLDNLSITLNLDIDQLPEIDDYAEQEWEAIEKEKADTERLRNEVDVELTQKSERLKVKEKQLSEGSDTNVSPLVAIGGILLGVLIFLFTEGFIRLAGLILAVRGIVALFKIINDKPADYKQLLNEVDELKEQIAVLEKQSKAYDQTLQNCQQNWQAFKLKYQLPPQADNWNSHRAIVDIEQITYYKNQLDDISKTLDSFYTRVDAFDKDIAVLKPFMTTKQHNLQAYIQEARSIVDNVLQQKSNQSFYIEENKQLIVQINHLKDNKNNINHKINVLYKTINASDKADYINRYKSFETEKEKYEEYFSLKETLKNDLNTYVIYDSKITLDERLIAVEKEIEDIDHHIQESRTKAVENLSNIHELENGGKYSDLLQSVENKKNELSELVDEWVELKLESGLIKLTLDEAQEGLLPETINQASKLFSTLTEGSYIEILFAEQTLKVKRNDGELFDAGELSTASGEQLYVALRFAFILSISSKLRLPIIVDDGFVNFDMNRVKVMWKIIEEMSKHTQVIAFTHEKSLGDVFQESEIILL